MDKKADTIIDTIDAIFAPFARSDAPGLVAGVAHNGQVIYRKGFGLASIEHGAINTPATRMRIGSTSKHFTCLAALLLAEDGKLDIDGAVHQYLPELPVLDGQPSLRQLMSHTAGYRCYLDVGFISDNLAIKPVGQALRFHSHQTAGNFKPGHKMIYSNSGYHLLSQVIARVSGVPFEDFLNDRIFAPLGMTDTRSVPSDFEIHPRMATLHIPLPDGSYRRGIFPTEDVRGEGAMISTIDDMLIWLDHFRGEKRVGTADSWRQLTTRTRLNDGEDIEYCLGLLKGHYRGVKVIHHAGGVFGGLCQMITVPDHALDIVIMTNGAAANPAELAHGIIDAVLGDKRLGARVERPRTENLAPIIGRYRARKSGMVFDLADVGGSVGFGVATNRAVPLEKAGSVLQLLFSGSGMGPYRIEIPFFTNNDPIQSLNFYDCGEQDHLDRITEDAPTAEDMAVKLGGSFFCDDMNASAQFSGDEQKIALKINGHFGGNTLAIDPVSDDLLAFEMSLVTQPFCGTISLHIKDNHVVGFSINSPRTRNLYFYRQP